MNLRRRLAAHVAGRRWRALKVEMSRVVHAQWQEVGSELEALLREAALIEELAPAANVQVGPPRLTRREVPRALVRDVTVLVPSVEADSIELVAARVDGGCLIQRTSRSRADLVVHATRLARFFNSLGVRTRPRATALAPIVFSWLARRGRTATRLDPHETPSPRALRGRLAALLAEERLFVERLDQRGSVWYSGKFVRPRRALSSVG